jgi:hypothetical protein
MIETTNLTVLARGLELRWRIGIFIRHLATAFIVSAALSLVFAVVHILRPGALPLGRLLLLGNGLAVIVALVQTALRRRAAQQLLADADHAYETRELLSSAIEFSEDPSRGANATEMAFRTVVAQQGDALSTGIDPARVYPFRFPRAATMAAGLFMAVGVLLLLDASGWFARPTVELSQEGLLLEEAGRRLAERSSNDELTELANEIRRLGERLRDGELDPDEARRRIDQLGESVEEQMRNLQRLDEFETNQNLDVPPETEDSIRSALRSGMTDGEVLEFFMSMRDGGDTLPDTLSALEGATADRPPDANLDIDNERIQELLDQLNLSPETQRGSDLAEQLANARQSLQQAGAGMESITEGLDNESGEAGESGAAGRLGPDDREQLPSEAPDEEGESSPGQEGGETAVADAMDDTFSRIEGANPIFRQIEGVMGEGTIRDVIVRELPSEAISGMTETEREVAFERVIEEAVGRENTPPELQHLIRNYFLRITLGKDQGEQNEQ